MMLTRTYRRHRCPLVHRAGEDVYRCVKRREHHGGCRFRLPMWQGRTTAAGSAS